jgi:hypothetical protein
MTRGRDAVVTGAASPLPLAGRGAAPAHPTVTSAQVRAHAIQEPWQRITRFIAALPLARDR